MDRRTSRAGLPMTRIAWFLPALLATGLLAGCIAPKTPPQTTPDPRPDPASSAEPELQPAEERTDPESEIAASIPVEPPAPEPAKEIEPVPAAAPAVAQIEPQEPTFDIPIEVNDQVLQWVDRYSGAYKTSFEAGMQRSGRYMEMFREIFAEAGVPRDLVYMAHVESGFKTRAYSRAHAKGIFQFISGTARHYGLRVDYWVDERSDPEKSARAAAQYMKKLYAEFGDWYLALAAYNAGEGTIRRAVSRTGSRDFWTLSRTRYLRRETKNHVPAVLAATLLYKDPKKYGLRFDPDPATRYDTIVVRGAVDLDVLARCAATDADTMRGLNPALRRNQTPPDGQTDLRLPPGAGPQAFAALALVPPQERVLYTRYRVQRGDTLSGIARKHGVSVSAIQETNSMGRRTMIHENRILLIPTSAASRYAAAGPAASPAVVGEPLAYRVRRGDTLFAIARRYDTTARSIAEVNGVPLHGVLGVDQRLTVVPGVQSPSASRKIAPVQNRGSDSASMLLHTVRLGDTLWRIAHLYQTSIHALCAWNEISQNTILHPGAKLTVGYR
jgi:membrane-bound lytic murein transglycosylase D